MRAEVVLHLTAKVIGRTVGTCVVTGSGACAQAQGGHVTSLGYINVLIGLLQTQLLALDGGFDVKRLGVYLLGAVGDAELKGIGIGLDHVKIFGRWQIQQLGQGKDAHAQVVLCLCYGELALCQCGALRCNLGVAGLAYGCQCCQALHLHGVNAYLVACHVQYAAVVYNLYECLCHLNADIVPYTLQVRLGGLQTKLGHLDIARYASAGKQGYIGADAERCAGCIGVGVGIVNGQASAE